MASGLDDLENILSGRPTDRQILAEFNKAELKRQNPAIYEPLLRENKNPKLEYFINTIRNSGDPLSDIDSMRAASYVLGSFRTIKDSVLDDFKDISDLDLSDIDLSDLDGFRELEELQEIAGYVKDIVQKLDHTSYILGSTVSVLEQHYKSLADAIRTVSDSRKMTIRATVENTSSLYEAKRIVIPQKDWAERFITITSRGRQEIMNSVATVGLLIEKSLGKTGISEEIVQTRDAYQKLTDATIAYKMRELDSIYAK